MNNKDRKKLQKEYAKENINFFFNLLKSRKTSQFDKEYIKEIKRFSESFNIRLNREEKLQFCKKCNSFWSSENKQIRLSAQNNCIEHICKKCGFIRRFKYK